MSFNPASSTWISGPSKLPWFSTKGQVVQLACAALSASIAAFGAWPKIKGNEFLSAGALLFYLLIGWVLVTLWILLATINRSHQTGLSENVPDKLEARILRGLFDDDGRAMYSYQDDYYQATFNSLMKRGYIQQAGKGFSLTPSGRQKTKEYLMAALRRM